MEIALYVLSAIGSAAVLIFFYISVRQVLDNSTEVDNLKRWYNNLDRSVDKAHDRYHDLVNRVDEIEGIVAGDIANLIKPKTRRK
jgi:hypothetical protein